MRIGIRAGSEKGLDPRLEWTVPMYLKEDHARYLLRDTLLFYVNIFSLCVRYGSRQSRQDASMHALICSNRAHLLKRVSFRGMRKGSLEEAQARANNQQASCVRALLSLSSS